MAFGLDDPDRQRAVLIGLLLLGAGYAFYTYVYSPVHEERVAVEERLETLEAANTEARTRTQPGRLRELREQEAEYQVQLARYETMLPAESEVPDLLEDVAGVALEQGVQIVEFTPLEPIEGESLIELRYDVEVQGGYHDTGQFLAGVVNLPRLIRPRVIEIDRVEVEEPTGDQPGVYEIGGVFEFTTYMPIDGADGQARNASVSRAAALDSEEAARAG